MQPTQKENALTYRKDVHLTESVYTKEVADLSRICEEEDAEIDWHDTKYCSVTERERLFNTNLLGPYFEVKSVMCSGADVVISKHYLIAQ